MLQIWKGLLNRRSKSDIDIGSKDRVVSPELFLLFVTTNYKPSSSFKRTVLNQLSEANFGRENWKAGFKEQLTKQEVLSEVSNRVVLRGHLRRFSSDLFTSIKTDHKIYSQLVLYRKKLLWLLVSLDVEPSVKERSAQGQDELLRSIKCSEGMVILRWRTRTDVSLSRFNTDEREENVIIVQVQQFW